MTTKTERTAKEFAVLALRIRAFQVANPSHPANSLLSAASTSLVINVERLDSTCWAAAFQASGFGGILSQEELAQQLAGTISKTVFVGDTANAVFEAVEALCCQLGMRRPLLS